MKDKTGTTYPHCSQNFIKIIITGKPLEYQIPDETKFRRLLLTADFSQ